MSSWVIIHRLLPSIGTAKSLSASFCKKIKEQLSTDCNAPVTSGLYWVNGIKVCICIVNDQYLIHVIAIDYNRILPDRCLSIVGWACSLVSVHEHSVMNIVCKAIWMVPVA